MVDSQILIWINKVLVLRTSYEFIGVNNFGICVVSHFLLPNSLFKILFSNDMGLWTNQSDENASCKNTGKLSFLLVAWINDGSKVS